MKTEDDFLVGRYKLAVPLFFPIVIDIIEGYCYSNIITVITYVTGGFKMIIKIDFKSDEAIYIQLRNQIIVGIASEKIQEGDALPSVRQLAENIGINMHTVNKAYTVLKQEGFIKLDRRKGAVISVDIDKIRAIEEMKKDMRVVLAKAICMDIKPEDAHEIVDQIYLEFLTGLR